MWRNRTERRGDRIDAEEEEHELQVEAAEGGEDEDRDEVR